MNAQKERIYKDVEFMTTLRPFRNYKNMESIEATANYIRKALQGIDLMVDHQLWVASANTYENVIASYNPEKKKRLIVGAHYDVYGDQPGADDNASAVAGLLETARLVAELQPEIDYRIDFVAYCLEEPPFFGTRDMGSYVHAESLYQDKADVMGMVCYEMIGYFSDEANSQGFPLPELAAEYPSTGNFIIVVGVEEHFSFSQRFFELMKKDSKIDVQVIHFPDSDGLAGLSDHLNYWNFGYPALMVNDTSFIRNPNYHQATDTIDTLDFDKITEVVNSSYRAIVNL